MTMIMILLLHLLLLLFICCHIICHCHPMIVMMIMILKRKIRFKNFFQEINLKKDKLKLWWGKMHGCCGGKNCHKLLFSESLCKVFCKVDEIFDNQRIDDDLIKTTILNTQSIKSWNFFQEEMRVAINSNLMECQTHRNVEGTQ